jgi:hypothetical protein
VGRGVLKRGVVAACIAVAALGVTTAGAAAAGPRGSAGKIAVAREMPPSATSARNAVSSRGQEPVSPLREQPIPPHAGVPSISLDKESSQDKGNGKNVSRPPRPSAPPPSPARSPVPAGGSSASRLAASTRSAGVSPSSAVHRAAPSSPPAHPPVRSDTAGKPASGQRPGPGVRPPVMNRETAAAPGFTSRTTQPARGAAVASSTRTAVQTVKPGEAPHPDRPAGGQAPVPAAPQTASRSHWSPDPVSSRLAPMPDALTRASSDASDDWAERTRSRIEQQLRSRLDRLEERFGSAASAPQSSLKHIERQLPSARPAAVRHLEDHALRSIDTISPGMDSRAGGRPRVSTIPWVRAPAFSFDQPDAANGRTPPAVTSSVTTASPSWSGRPVPAAPGPSAPGGISAPRPALVPPTVDAGQVVIGAPRNAPGLHQPAGRPNEPASRLGPARPVADGDATASPEQSPASDQAPVESLPPAVPPAPLLAELIEVAANTVSPGPGTSTGGSPGLLLAGFLFSILFTWHRLPGLDLVKPREPVPAALVPPG